MSPAIRKPSFAVIAASATRSTVLVTLTSDRPRQAEPASIVNKAVVPSTSVMSNVVEPQINPAFDQAAIDDTTEDLKDLNLNRTTPSLAVNGTSTAFFGRMKRLTRDGSDESQKADSSSDLGTKPSSVDGKSVTSGTTFAMDEKESLRPDDSASVKATAEDDDAFSIRSSLLASRLGSDLAGRARGYIQLGDMPDRRLPNVIIPPNLGVVTPQCASSEQPGVPVNDAIVPNALHVIYGTNPDDRLLESMNTMKDRFFLLRLENQLINFVTNSKEPYMDVRQGQDKNNTFYRMLAHKLADYYHMTHSYEPSVDAVRIFRTPFCRVPTSLADLTTGASATIAAPPIMLPRKIMRRGQDGELARQCASPSKAASEVGSEVNQKPILSKEKKSREEREEEYKAARERIFGNPETAEETSESGIEGEISRTSSSSIKDNLNGKRGRVNRRKDSDGFDSQIRYPPFWVSQPQSWLPPCHLVSMGGALYPSGYQPPSPQNFGVPQLPTAYTPSGLVSTSGIPPGSFPSGYNHMPPYSPQPTQARYLPINNGVSIPPTASPPSAPQLGYPSPVSISAFQGRVPAQPGSAGIPYLYGQLPVNMDPNSLGSQHPIPGSYNRLTTVLNPTIQSFVPGAASSFSVAALPGSPQMGTSQPFPTYQGPPVPPQFGNAPVYGMSRQESDGSFLPYQYPQQHPQHPHPPSIAQTLPQLQSHYSGCRLPNKPNALSTIIGQHPTSHLSSYGNPASLPQKPTTGI